jgi:hypothetical protein
MTNTLSPNPTSGKIAANATPHMIAATRKIELQATLITPRPKMKS